MTTAELVTATETRLNDDTAPSYTRAELLAGLNAAQLVFAFLTLCLERTDTVDVTDVSVSTLVQIPDYLVPLRVKSGSRKLRPATLAMFAGQNPRWWGNPAAAQRYAARGSLLLFDGVIGSIALTHAHLPALLVEDGDVPEIPDSYHAVLPDYAAWRALLPQGGQELEKGKEYLRSFFSAASELAATVRTRSLAQRYDTLPPERERFDISRLLKIRPDLLPARKETPDANGSGNQ